MIQDPKILIAIPSGTEWKADFGMSLAFMIAASTRVIPGIGFPELHVHNVRGSILSRSRQQCVEKAIKKKMDYILFIDSDMTFPPTLLQQLLMDRVDVVAANCVTKSRPAVQTARLESKTSRSGTPLVTHGEGLQKVWRVGTGIMLIAIDIFEHIPTPYFDITWCDEAQDYVGEDWTFCEKLQHHGVGIYVDHAISKHVGHIGPYTYTHTDTE